MVIRIATLAVFTFLLFAVSTANIVLDPVALPGSDVVITTANDQLQESAKTQTFDVSMIDPDSRGHSVDRTTRDPLRFVRHHHHPCRKFKKMVMIPTKMFYGNDMILSDKPTSADLKTIGDQKYEFGEQRLNSMTGHHKDTKREHKGGFMRSVRKFLKHTFD